jgi:hypothetical protein
MMEGLIVGGTVIWMEYCEDTTHNVNNLIVSEALVVQVLYEQLVEETQIQYTSN